MERKEEVKILRERAKTFLENARFNFKNKKFDVAAFNIEQFCQLYLKAKLVELTGEFSKTHSLIELLKQLPFVSKKVNTFIKKNVEYLTKLEDVYVTARYLPRKFLKEEVENLFKFASKFKKFVDGL